MVAPDEAAVAGTRHEHVPWATPGPTGMTEKLPLENPISALSGGIFSAEYSCSLLCSPMSFLSGKPQ